MANLSTFSDLQTHLQTIIGDTNIDSTFQTDILNSGYEEIAYRYNWSFLKRIYAKNILAYETNYDLPSDFREFVSLKILGNEYNEVDRAEVRENNNVFAIDRRYEQIIINPIPTTNQNTTTVTNLESAGADVEVEVGDASIFAVGDEVWIDNATNPQTSIASVVDTTNNDITITLDQDTAATDAIWVLEDGIYGEYFKTITKLSAGGDTTDLPVRLRPLIAEYAAYLYFLQLEDRTRANFWLESFERKLLNHWYNEQSLSQTHGSVKFGIK